MAIDNFIPELWANTLLSELRPRLVFGQAGVVNRDYESEFTRYGDTIHIHDFADVSLEDYTKNSNMSGPETLDDSRKTFVIDQAKSFNFQIDDIDKAQQKPKIMQAAMRRAARVTAEAIEQFLVGLFAASDPANNVDYTDGNEYEALVDLGVKLDKQNVDRDNRFVVVTPEFHGQLLKDSRFVAAGDDAGAGVRMNGEVGRAAGLRVLVSNFVTAGEIIAGSPEAASFAQQVQNVEAYRPELRHADAVKGLTVYGGSLLRPEAAAVGTLEAAA